MQHDHVLEKLNFDLLTSFSRNVCVFGGGGGAGKIFATMLGVRGCRQNICYHVAAFVILFNLICICNMTLF